MIPGLVRNWLRTSKTILPAARPTALIARPLNRKTTDAPMITPISTFGPTISNLGVLLAWYFTSALVIVSVYEPNRALAASTAVAIAMPFVMALVVLPTASSW